MIYFDNNATSPLLPEVRAAIQPYLETDFGNPNSVHQQGTRARAAIEKARGRVARTLGVLPSEITFTGSGSESNNHAVIGTILSGSLSGNIVTSAVEHASVGATVRWATKKFGLELRVAPFRVTEHGVDPAPFIERIDKNTRLVSVMAANNETGVLIPVTEIFAAAKGYGAVCHTDAIQGVGKIPIQPGEIGADLLSFSAHKFHGPKGSGGLYIKRGLKIESLIHGGAQENARRAGTENVANIIGLDEALAQAIEHGSETVRGIRDYFETRIGHAGWEGVVINFGTLARTPNVSSVRFQGRDGNLFVIKLDRKGFCVSTGSACNSGALSASPGLMAAGLSEEEASATLRFSFSRFNTRDEIDRLIEALNEMLSGRSGNKRVSA